jgi:hypothetical protein
MVGSTLTSEGTARVPLEGETLSSRADPTALVETQDETEGENTPSGVAGAPPSRGRRWMRKEMAHYFRPTEKVH